MLGAYQYEIQDFECNFHFSFIRVEGARSCYASHVDFFPSSAGLQWIACSAAMTHGPACSIPFRSGCFSGGSEKQRDARVYEMTLRVKEPGGLCYSVCILLRDASVYLQGT